MKQWMVILMFSAVAAHAKWEPATVTFYCACELCCGDWAALGLTASGKKPVEGRTVAGPRSVKFGTRVYIKGVGWRVVEDRTAKEFDGRWDVFVKDHARAVKLGKKETRILTTKSTKNTKSGRSKTEPGTEQKVTKETKFWNGHDRFLNLVSGRGRGDSFGTLVAPIGLEFRSTSPRRFFFSAATGLTDGARVASLARRSLQQRDVASSYPEGRP